MTLRVPAILAAVAVTTLSLQAAGTCPGHGNRSTMLVSAQWLSSHLKDPNVVVIGVGPKAEFDKGHIPGAVSLELSAVSAKNVPLTLELPPLPELAETFSALGVSNNSHVVLYSVANSVQSATRIYLTLDAMGLGRNTSLLDGGFVAWKTGGNLVTTEVGGTKRGSVEPCAQSDIIVNAEYVSANLRTAGIDVVDSRLPAFYTGEQIPNNQRA